jgi:DNA integrity scanning protein DisA with diadenylate cyclase activity
MIFTSLLLGTAQLYGISKYFSLKDFLELPDGIAFANIFWLVFESINSKQLEQFLNQWLQDYLASTATVPIGL